MNSGVGCTVNNDVTLSFNQLTFPLYEMCFFFFLSFGLPFIRAQQNIEIEKGSFEQL